MVDAAALFNGNARSPIRSVPLAKAEIGWTVDIHADLASYDVHAADLRFAPAQSPVWLAAWAGNAQPDIVVAIARHDGVPAICLALEVIRAGGFRIARFASGRHANGNFPAARLDAPGASEAAQALIEAVRLARRDVDVIALERLLPALDGVANPLLSLPHFPSPNLALSVDLSGGFDALLARTSGRRKRKKHRSQMRKFETAGGYRRIEAKSPQEVDRLLDAFFEMKAARFRKMGIRDVFAEPGTQGFFRQLFVAALADGQRRFLLHGLEVGGVLRAVTGSSRTSDRITCEFGAIAEDDLAFASPGDFLFFENIHEACDEGLAVYDFGVGDEPYKRLWCDVETEHMDALVPLTAKGRILAASMRGSAKVKAFVKNSPLVWTLTKRLRRKVAGQADAED